MIDAAVTASCALCQQPIAQERSIATTTGEQVHITCADRDARRAYRVRLRVGLVQGMALLGATTLHLGVRTSEVTLIVTLVLVLIFAVTHGGRAYRRVQSIRGQWKVRGRRDVR